MVRKIKLLFNTLKYLKPIQVIYQIRYRVQKPKALASYNVVFDLNKICFLSFKENPPVFKTYLGGDEFVFLNQKKQFSCGAIDWNFQGFGKLWNYNLQYANYLLHPKIEITERERLLMSLYESLHSGALPLEPYPASLRIINVIRFFSLLNYKNKKGLSFLHAELDFLSKRLEFHLLGNHLLENSFALIMGGAFFSNAEWITAGRKVLESELNEQILEDGAHFELSPMYHQIIFFRVLELIDWYSSWNMKDKNLGNYINSAAIKMRAWLENISFKNGDIPHFNDSAIGIAYSTNWLIRYAESLGVQLSNIPLGASGYRSAQQGSYECKIDFAAIGARYQPGHAHADSLSFILYYKNEPLFVEAGTSTYQIGEVRSKERSTSSHNTVVVDGMNQSQIWGGFRVAERAATLIHNDTSIFLSAEHDGYKTRNIIHHRTFTFGENSLKIEDQLKENIHGVGEFILHVFPGLEIEMDNDQIKIKHEVSITFLNPEEISLMDYEMADGFNQYHTGKKIVVRFKEKLETMIKFL